MDFRRMMAWFLFFLMFVLPATFLSATPPEEPSETKIVFLLFDGCRADTLERLCRTGKTPTLAALKQRGLWVNSAITVFPSTTGPAYAPFITGHLPIKSDLAGIRQYIRTTGTYRSYCGTDFAKIKSDMNPSFPTIYEMLPSDSMSIFGVIDRGSKRSISPPIPFFIDNLRGDYVKCDQRIFQTLMKKTKVGLPRFTFCSFHGPDSVGHRIGADGPPYEAAIISLDRMLAQFLRQMKDAGELDNLCLIISSDHGSESVDKKGDLAPLLRQKLGLEVQDAIGRSTVGFNLAKKANAQKYDAIVCISGNACVQIYVKGRVNPKDSSDKGSFRIPPTLEQLRNYRRSKDGRFVGDIIGTLLESPCVEHVLVKSGRSAYRVFSRQGEGLIRASGNALSYEIVRGTDPLRMNVQARRLSTGRMIHERKWLRLTAEDPYPDALFQIAQLLETKNAGDIIINAAARYEPWHEGQNGLHGGLSKAQMQVPILMWGKGVPQGELPVARTIDLFPTMLKLLGLRISPELPGLPLF